MSEFIDRQEIVNCVDYMESSLFRAIDNQRGLTLMELVISLGLVAILIVAFASGNIFVHKLLGNWSTANRLCEEREYLLTTFFNMVASCDSLRQDADTRQMVFYYARDSLVCNIENGMVLIDGVRQNHPDIAVTRLDVSRRLFTYESSDSILTQTGRVAPTCLYDFEIKLSYRGETDGIRTVIRNIRQFTRR